MDLGLEGRVAAITAAGSGIGLATAKVLAAEGVRVIGADLKPADLKAVDGAVPVELDMSVPDAAQHLVDTALSKFGRLDVLVNGVGMQPERPDGFLSVSDQDWQQLFTLNFLSAVRCIRASLPAFLAQGSGSIINVGSIAAREPSPFAPDYAATKAALLSLTKTVSMEFGSRNVRCNIVAPGPTLTPVFKHWLQDRASRTGRSLAEEIRHFTHGRRRMALDRAGEPEDVAAVIAFLASDRARQITGSEYRVDGGAMQSVL